MAKHRDQGGCENFDGEEHTVAQCRKMGAWLALLPSQATPVGVRPGHIRGSALVARPGAQKIGGSR